MGVFCRCPSHLLSSPLPPVHDMVDIEPVGGSCNPRKFLETPLYVSHVGKSMYPVQLERWFNLFGRENLKVWVTFGGDFIVGGFC